MKKKIYFAGSIRGGRDFADLYRKMIEHMQMTDIVLTEHIGQADLNLKKREEPAMQRFITRIQHGSERAI